MFGLTLLIKDPTRICKSAQNIIDLILVSDKENISQSGVIEYALSDYFLIAMESCKEQHLTDTKQLKLGYSNTIQ